MGPAEIPVILSFNILKIEILFICENKILEMVSSGNDRYYNQWGGMLMDEKSDRIIDHLKIVGVIF